MIRAKFKMVNDDNAEKFESLGIEVNNEPVINTINIIESSVGAFFRYSSDDGEEFIEILIHGCSFPVLYDEEVEAQLMDIAE
jgi:hypothetical protein